MFTQETVRWSQLIRFGSSAINVSFIRWIEQPERVCHMDLVQCRINDMLIEGVRKLMHMVKKMAIMEIEDIFQGFNDT
jgi:hypothetical protein